MSQLLLGISSENLDKIKKCSIIFHSAASIRFEDPLKEAILLNLRGTREICQLAMQMPNLKSFVHLSTAFIKAETFYADEILYSSCYDWRKIIEIAEKFDNDVINCLDKK